MNKYIKEYYFLIVPILITLIVYLVSLSYPLRNFDEDVLIKNFYVPKTLGEYIEKLFLIHFGGATEAHGFTFSSVKNIHVSILGIPLFYLISYLFHGKAFLFHLWDLFLHCLAVYFFTCLCYKITSNKKIALFSALAWTLHPTNVEPVIWATNWAQLLGGALYFYTLNKIVSTPTTIFILFITTAQIFFTEHTITIPLAILITALYFTKDKITSLKISLPSFVVVLYWILRNLLIAKSHAENLNTNIIFLSPQIFLHELKIIFFPKNLSIDQIDFLNLNGSLTGIAIFISVLILSLLLKNKFKNLSYGLILYIITLLPFIQIIPLYSLVAERYNYFGSAFLLFGIVSFIFQHKFKKGKHIGLPLLISLCLVLGVRSYTRILEWKDSSSLFLSTINTSKSLFKKGIWTYNLAISQEDKNKKEDLLNLSSNLLELFIQNTPLEKNINPFLLKYELDNKSLFAKAALRIATNSEILNEKDKQLEYLLKALAFSRPNSQIQAAIFKDLGTYYFQKNNFNKAIEFYNRSNSISENSTINYAIALCYLKLNDFNNYEKYLKKAVSEISPSNVAPFRTYAQFLELNKHDYKNAIKYYKIATLLENKVESYILLATLYLKQNQINNAYKIVKRGLHSFSDDPTLTYLDGAINLNKGNKQTGIKKLKKAIEHKDCPEDIRTEASNILENIKK
ncbi:MAG: hypothetical protein HYY52_06150 [Candidatus Melainabacteria bacterium]|nr:hypothetical protein [Candidatus Melainabacteria bacterium]